MRLVHSVLVAICVLLAGCMGSPVDPGAGLGGELIEVAPGTEPLDPLDEEHEWQEAPAGCEGRLPALAWVTFRIASLNDGLVAAIDFAGHIVCVDTIESVQAELEQQGEGDRADELGDRFLVAVTLSMPDPMGVLRADPTPQPNIQISGMRPCGGGGGSHCGDPTPQPNIDP